MPQKGTIVLETLRGHWAGARLGTDDQQRIFTGGQGSGAVKRGMILPTPLMTNE